MMKPTLACFLLLACLLAAQTGAPAVVPVAEEPSHHLAFENEYVRVFKVEVAPHAATLMHRHDRDYIFVTLGDSEVISERQGEKPVTLQLKDGEARFTKGGFAHIARNLSDKPFRNVTVELVRPGGQGPFDKGTKVMAWEGEGWSQTQKDMDRVRVTWTELQPGATLRVHEHKVPHLAIALTDLELLNDVDGKPPAALEMKDGDVKWVSGGFKHSLTNTGDGPARFVILEFE
jgi:quercetin dioxygenase-like cupin family protein